MSGHVWDALTRRCTGCHISQVDWTPGGWQGEECPGLHPPETFLRDAAQMVAELNRGIRGVLRSAMTLPPAGEEPPPSPRLDFGRLERVLRFAVAAFDRQRDGTEQAIGQLVDAGLDLAVQADGEAAASIRAAVGRIRAAITSLEWHFRRPSEGGP